MFMARERERVFSMSKFSTHVATEQDEQMRANPYGRIYGDYGAESKHVNAFVEAAGGMYNDSDSEEDQYIEPPRESYPEDRGIVAFAEVARESRRQRRDPNDIEMEF